MQRILATTAVKNVLVKKWTSWLDKVYKKIDVYRLVSVLTAINRS